MAARRPERPFCAQRLTARVRSRRDVGRVAAATVLLDPGERVLWRRWFEAVVRKFAPATVHVRYTSDRQVQTIAAGT